MINILKTHHKIALAYLALITAHLIWGSNFVVAKLTLQEFPVMSLAFIRFSLAMALLTPFILAEKKKVNFKMADLPHLIIIGVLMVTLNIALFYEGLSRTSAVDASILTLSIPLMSVIFSWWFLKEKVYLINILGIFTGLIGAILIIGLPTLNLDKSNQQTILGNILIIMASLTWVIGSVLSKKVLQKYSTLDLTVVLFFVGIVTFFLPALLEYFQNPLWPAKVTYLGILGLTFIALLSSISAYYLFEWGINKLGVIKANLFQYIEPIIATILAVAILNETIGPFFIFGALLIGLGVYWGTLAKEEHHRRHKAHRT